ncbi:putative transposase for insertion sequence element IS801 domain protein [Escherichia coli 3-373-03_S4_C3]|nr:putative transposase for insertion sequence element IS801 domain protein [Escherichia coli 3-373-03_S4_C2]KDU49126.1 putative transposase for insertion sequence element IS801 domain protein [Escherichia coli 3-373-03_S4_C1]KEL20803.1 putative transposase for insertion sequence element IS801 domain protein [Escherichia coli 3-373-03_S4_C3]
MVKEVLKAVARANNHPYQSVFADFITGHPSCTVCFRETFHKMYPDSPYEYVTFCHTCRRFDLYETEAEMKADDPKWGGFSAPTAETPVHSQPVLDVLPGCGQSARYRG